MDIAALERMIAQAIADMVRAQQLAAPVLDLCLPGMVNAEKHARWVQARFDLAIASVYAHSATGRLQNASALLAEYLQKRDHAPPA